MPTEGESRYFVPYKEYEALKARLRDLGNRRKSLRAESTTVLKDLGRVQQETKALEELTLDACQKFETDRVRWEAQRSEVRDGNSFLREKVTSTKRDVSRLTARKEAASSIMEKRRSWENLQRSCISKKQSLEALKDDARTLSKTVVDKDNAVRDMRCKLVDAQEFRAEEQPGNAALDINNGEAGEVQDDVFFDLEDDQDADMQSAEMDIVNKTRAEKGSSADCEKEALPDQPASDSIQGEPLQSEECHQCPSEQERAVQFSDQGKQTTGVNSKNSPGDVHEPLLSHCGGETVGQEDMETQDACVLANEPDTRDACSVEAVNSLRASCSKEISAGMDTNEGDFEVQELERPVDGVTDEQQGDSTETPSKECDLGNTTETPVPDKGMEKMPDEELSTENPLTECDLGNTTDTPVPDLAMENMLDQELSTENPLEECDLGNITETPVPDLDMEKMPDEEVSTENPLKECELGNASETPDCDLEVETATDEHVSAENSAKECDLENTTETPDSDSAMESIPVAQTCHEDPEQTVNPVNGAVTVVEVTTEQETDDRMEIDEPEEMLEVSIGADLEGIAEDEEPPPAHITHPGIGSPSNINTEHTEVEEHSSDKNDALLVSTSPSNQSESQAVPSMTDCTPARTPPVAVPGMTDCTPAKTPQATPITSFTPCTDFGTPLPVESDAGTPLPMDMSKVMVSFDNALFNDDLPPSEERLAKGVVSTFEKRNLVEGGETAGSQEDEGSKQKSPVMGLVDGGQKSQASESAVRSASEVSIDWREGEVATHSVSFAIRAGSEALSIESSELQTPKGRGRRRKSWFPAEGLRRSPRIAALQKKKQEELKRKAVVLEATVDKETKTVGRPKKRRSSIIEK